MAFPYKNPTSLSLLNAPEGVTQTSNVGTNFSVSQVGGYQEVYYLENLELIFSGTGTQTLSANTIPIVINVQPNSGFNFTQLTLNSDNISSGRRRLGMQVYVNETDTVYQYHIPNYDDLWNSVTGLTGNSGITQQETFTTINGRSQQGRNFINMWTGSTIEGYNGVTREEARWRIFYGTDVQITGGTYNSGTTTLDLFNSTGGTVSITGVTTGGGGSGSSTEYLSINAVPSSYGILAWDNLQPFRDTYVTIPKDFNGRTITSVTASYGDSASTTNAVFELQMKNSNNSVASSVSWTHTGDNRSYQEIFGSGLTLASGNTLNLFYSSTPPDGNAKGYSATFEISN
jgi:hypothetical protein